MQYRKIVSPLVIIALGFVFLSGCGEETADVEQSTNSNSAAAINFPQLSDAEKAEIAASFAELSEEDRALAEQQIICPVAGGPLGAGAMGVPIKVMVKTADGVETPVFVCCAGCTGALEANPEEYLAKLPNHQ